MVGILVALVISTTIFSTIKFTEYTSMLLHERIVVASNGLRKFIYEAEDDTRASAIAVAADTDVINAVEKRNTEDILRALENTPMLYRMDAIVITDATGTVLASTLFPDRYGDSIADQLNIQFALQGKVHTCMEDTPSIKVAVRSGAPIYNADGILIGAAVTSIRFDTEATLDKLKEHYNAEFSVFYGDRRIATTISVEGERVIGSQIDADIAKYVYSTKKEHFGVVDIYGENFNGYYFPIVNIEGEVFAMIGAGCSNAKFLAEKFDMQMSIMLIGFLMLVVSIVILLFVTSNILKPLARLSHLVSEVSSGNIDYIDMDETSIAKDEIGLLTLDIHTYIKIIRSIIHDLSYVLSHVHQFEDRDICINVNKYAGSHKKIINGIMELVSSIAIMRKTMAAMDYLDTMISVIDFDYNLLYINSSMAHTFGIDQKSCIGKKCYEAIRNLDQPCSICQLPKLLLEQDTLPSIDYEDIFDTVSGKYLGGRAAIIRWVDGTQVFFHAARDETIKTKYREHLHKAMQATEALSAAKTAFIANMSHEIRTPMNSIIGFSELALCSEPTPITKEYLLMIQENGEWLLQIINNILDISKVESGRLELEIIPFRLRDLLDVCNKTILPRAVEKNIGLHFYTESSIGKILLGDPTRLRQVLNNLLSNAVKFTTVGSVTLSVAVKNETENTITLRFEVKDTGIGIAPQQIKRIFVPFMQGDISTTRKYGGTGLGMTITKNILDLMGSKIDVQSEPGAGTSISFELLFDTTEMTSDLSANTIQEIDKPMFDGDVLVCEDNQMNRRVIKDHLARVGLNAEIAQNGLEGIKKVQKRLEHGEKPFDLILMDIHMPVMDGLEAASQIMQIGTGTPIVAMTANIMADDKKLYKIAGMENYLGKPFSSQELWRCLLKHLEPVAFSITEESGKEDAALQTQLKTDFVKSNQSRCDEIKNAIEAGDITLAHRLAHSLKSNAGLIGKTALQEAATEVEAALRGGESRVTEEQMRVLRSEMSAALSDLGSYLQDATDTQAPVDFDVDTARALIGKLEPLLKSGNPECLDMINGLKAVPGSGEVIRLMEDFYFGDATKALSALKEKLEQGATM